MPPLPTIPDVYRVVVNWETFSGIAPRNVFHIGKGGSTVAAIGVAVNSAFNAGTSGDSMWTPLHSSFQCSSVSITALDGTSPGVDVAIDTIQGGTGGEFEPAMAAVMSFKTARKGPRGRGRQYIGPIADSAANAGVLDVAPRDSMLLGWTAFIDDLVSTSNAALVVASYVHHDYNVVTSQRADTLVGTMRRRQDQLR